jgi:phospholipid/cholesterol/gamma-HCH transport system ATP-binding protein
MAEEKDATEREAEAAAGVELPPLPPVPYQLQPSNGLPRKAERPPGQWCAEHGVRVPAGSFDGRPALVALPEERAWPTS